MQRHSTHPARRGTRDALVVGLAGVPGIPAARGRGSPGGGRGRSSSDTLACCSAPRRRPRLRRASSSSRWASSAAGLSLLGGGFELLPAVEESLHVGLGPAELVEQALVDLLALHLLGERFEHEVGLLAGVLEIGGVGIGGGAVGLGGLHHAVGRRPAPSARRCRSSVSLANRRSELGRPRSAERLIGVLCVAVVAVVLLECPGCLVLLILLLVRRDGCLRWLSCWRLLPAR